MRRHDMPARSFRTRLGVILGAATYSASILAPPAILSARQVDGVFEGWRIGWTSNRGVSGEGIGICTIPGRDFSVRSTAPLLSHLGAYSGCVRRFGGILPAVRRGGQMGQPQT